MKTVRFGIIGAGRIANKFCDAVKHVQDAEVVAVASQTVGKAETFAKENEILNWYTSYETMLQDATIDVVYIGTTHNFHYENLKVCLAYKKAILCEKPLVLTEQQAVEISEMAKHEGIFLMEAMWSRFLPAVQKAKEWIVNGAIGEVELSHALIGFRGTDDPTHRLLNPELAGGAMYDIGVYGIEMMTYLIGEKIQEVQPMNQYGVTGVDVTNTINLRFENSVANIQSSFRTYCQPEIKIYGTEGYIVIPNMHYTTECTLYKGKEKAEHFKAPEENGFIYEVEEVVACMKRGVLESDIMPHAATIECARLFEVCLKK